MKKDIFNYGFSFFLDIFFLAAIVDTALSLLYFYFFFYKKAWQ